MEYAAICYEVIGDKLCLLALPVYSFIVLSLMKATSPLPAARQRNAPASPL